jgi:dihydrofolate synthase/folylpolyglutamate synthase
MNYQQTLDYLFTKLPMFSRFGAAAYKKDLTNTLQLLDALGNPHQQFKTIHIAGTNGKGSTSHMLAAVLQTAGYKTGLYTSPHLKDFRERIKLNGQFISETFVIDFVEKIQDIAETIQPSFFELTVAMAFDFFAKEKVDIAVIETGLGGRLDSTNVIVPELSIITNIGWDHTNLLGNTLPAIAFEKAGIIKKHIPIVIGELQPEVLSVFEQKAMEQEAQLWIAPQLFYANEWSYEHHRLTIQIVKTGTNDQWHYQLDLPGVYQTKNCITVLAAIYLLKQKGWNLQQPDIQKGLAHTKKITGLHGRWELIHQHPAVILDVAHNENGIQQVIEQLSFCRYHRLHIVIGLVKDKEIDTILSLLPSDADYYFTRAQIPRALPEAMLQQKATQLGKKGHHYPTVNDAVKTALSRANREDLILVCGSVFVVGEVTL